MELGFEDNDGLSQQACTALAEEYPARSWYSFTDPGGMKVELALGGWLITYRSVQMNDECLWKVSLKSLHLVMV